MLAAKPTSKQQVGCKLQPARPYSGHCFFPQVKQPLWKALKLRVHVSADPIDAFFWGIMDGPIDPGPIEVQAIWIDPQNPS